MHVNNIPAPPPPAYPQTVGFGLGNQYYTQYSSPLQQPGAVQPPLSQSFGQHSYNPGYGPGVAQQQPLTIAPQANQVSPAGFPRTRHLQLQRLAIVSIVCFFPIGILAWFQLQKAKAAFDRGSNSDGEQHVARFQRCVQVSIFFGFLIMVVIIINPLRFIDFDSSEGNREDNAEKP